MHNIFGKRKTKVKIIFLWSLCWCLLDHQVILPWIFTLNPGKCRSLWPLELFLKFFILSLWFIVLIVLSQLLFLTFIMIHEQERVVWGVCSWCPCGSFFSLLLLVNYAFSGDTGFILRPLLLKLPFTQPLVENWPIVLCYTTSRSVKNCYHLAEFTNSMCFLGFFDS
jgi:hypothetical protein